MVRHELACGAVKKEGARRNTQLVDPLCVVLARLIVFLANLPEEFNRLIDAVVVTAPLKAELIDKEKAERTAEAWVRAP